MKQGFIICTSYAKELKSITEKLNLSDTETLIVPSTCANINSLESAYFVKQRDDFEKNITHSSILMSRNCIACEKASGRNTSNSHDACPSLCLENFLPPKLLNHYIEKKYYIITPGWLLQWKHTIINRWKFDKKTAPIFFNDTAKKILVVDTGVYGNYDKQLKEFSEFIDLKYAILPFGIDYFEKTIETITYKQRHQKISDDFLKFKKEVNQKISEYAMIIDLIPSLSKIRSEELVIGKIIELYTILFAPQKITYVKNSRKNKLSIQQSDHENFSVDDLLAKCTSDENCFINENQKGFITKINFDKKVYAYILIENILFPKYLSRYINFTQSLIPFFGLLIFNARQFEELEKLKNTAEKGKREYQNLSDKYKMINSDLTELNHEYESLLKEQKQNIEEITTLNEDLLNKNEELDELNATKDKFFNIISHDLRNPFNAILGLSDLLIRNIDNIGDDEIKNFARLINDAGKNTLNLLTNLLEWSRSQQNKIPFNPQNNNLYELAHETYKLLNHAANKKNTTINLDIPQEISFESDSEMIKTIIRNLVSNAIKYTRAKGEITISGKQIDNSIIIQVSDTGIGMSETTIKALFKIGGPKSQKGTNGERGTGFGLLLCKEFVDKHNGTITVESELRKGSRFIVTLPLKTE